MEENHRAALLQVSLQKTYHGQGKMQNCPEDCSGFTCTEMATSVGQDHHLINLDLSHLKQPCFKKTPGEQNLLGLDIAGPLGLLRGLLSAWDPHEMTAQNIYLVQGGSSS
jgi:hypothetical protein